LAGEQFAAMSTFMVRRAAATLACSFSALKRGASPEQEQTWDRKNFG
jgi:hypothetical protein